SVTHGLHQVAQKLTTTTLSARASGVWTAPVVSRKTRGGKQSGVPGRQVAAASFIPSLTPSLAGRRPSKAKAARPARVAAAALPITARRLTGTSGATAPGRQGGRDRGARGTCS